MLFSHFRLAAWRIPHLAGCGTSEAFERGTRNSGHPFVKSLQCLVTKLSSLRAQANSFLLQDPAVRTALRVLKGFLRILQLKGNELK